MNQGDPPPPNAPRPPEPDPQPDAGDDREQAQLMTCPPFEAVVLRRQIEVDTLLRWGPLIALGALIVVDGQMRTGNLVLWQIILVVFLVVWFMLNAASARAWQMLPQITMLLDSHPAMAEDLLARALKRKALHRSVRLLLYHRLAVLRHRQHRFEEAAAICEAVLKHARGTVKPVKPHLYLMLVEAKLNMRELPAAEAALGELRKLPIGLLDRMQAVALHTRLEVAAGRDAQALEQIGRKIACAELMPATPCGLLHALLARAARNVGQTDLANWLDERARLLCTREQLDQLAETGDMLLPRTFDTAIV